MYEAQSSFSDFKHVTIIIMPMVDLMYVCVCVCDALSISISSISYVIQNKYAVLPPGYCNVYSVLCAVFYPVFRVAIRDISPKHTDCSFYAKFVALIAFDNM